MVEPSHFVEPGAGPVPQTRSGSGRRLGLLALGAAGAAALVAAIVVLPGEWRVFQQRNTELKLARETAGLRLDESPEAQGTADYLRTALAASMDLKSTVGAVYADPVEQSLSVIFIGGTATLREPESDLDRLFQLVTDKADAVAGVRTVPPGPLGGVMKCGASSGPDEPMAVCGWADNGSLAVAMFPNRAIDESAVLLRAMRADLERRP
ncbi:MAG TPA: hypothetical protein VFB84_01980 [Micromonosporaceae bacterium]|nr:hypothetical protein [Micromonosporaceae bacterium]